MFNKGNGAAPDPYGGYGHGNPPSRQFISTLSVNAPTMPAAALGLLDDDAELHQYMSQHHSQLIGRTTMPMPMGHSAGADTAFTCLWRLDTATQYCGLKFDDGGSLFKHITETHVGRKNYGNLCLDCRWQQCQHSTEKRDHIVSHIRTHVPSFRPFVCQACTRAFSRAQDLRKHEKLHDRLDNNQSAASRSPTQPGAVYPHPFLPQPQPAASSFIPQPQYGYNSGVSSLPHYSSSTQLPFQETQTTHAIPIQIQLDAMLRQSQPGNNQLQLLQQTVPRRVRANSYAGPSSAPPTTHLTVPSHKRLASDFQSRPQSGSGSGAFQELVGQIKRKKLTPQYSQDLADQLEVIASYVGGEDFRSGQETPTQQQQQQPQQQIEHQQRPLTNSVVPAPQHTVDSLFEASIAISDQEFDQLNSFFSELYENIQLPVNNSSPPKPAIVPAAPPVSRSSAPPMRPPLIRAERATDQFAQEMKEYAMDLKDAAWTSDISQLTSEFTVDEKEVAEYFSTDSLSAGDASSPTKINPEAQQSADRVEMLRRTLEGVAISRGSDRSQTAAHSKGSGSSVPKRVARAQAILQPTFSDPSMLVRLIDRQSNPDDSSVTPAPSLLSIRSGQVQADDSGLESFRPALQRSLSSTLAVAQRDASSPTDDRRTSWAGVQGSSANVSIETRTVHLQLIRMILQRLEAAWKSPQAA